MNLAGKFEFNGTKFYLFMNDVQKSETFILLSPYHRQDRFAVATGDNASYPVIHTVDQIKKKALFDYAIEVIERRKLTGKVNKFGNDEIIESVISSIGMARSYSFSKEDIQIHEKEFASGQEHVIFGAADNNIQFNYETRNGLYTYLRVKTREVFFELSRVWFNMTVKGLPMHEVEHQLQKRILVSSIKKVDYNVLAESLDMSWYREDGITKKKYQSIGSNTEFELKIVREFIHRIMECQKQGIQADVAVDTETTGLNVYNLDKDNPDKDHCVAIPICWKVGESNVIFTDMEHFNNADNDYVVSRLSEFFEKFDGRRTIEYYDYPEGYDENNYFAGSSDTEMPVLRLQEVNSRRTAEMSVFGNDPGDGFEEGWDDSFLEEEPSDNTGNGYGDNFDRSAAPPALVKKTFTFKRGDINLIGHNASFDGRVFYDSGKEFWFDQDTLQMAFDINPQSVRGNKKLKVLTRFFFNAETPELDDVLGKGNEDKYKYLSDREVAEIYGCADGDYTLAVYYKLRHLMPDKMYYWYRKQDIPMINILYKSEYYGMRAVESKLKVLADETKENIEILKDTVYSYVGVYMQYTNEMNLERSKMASGLYKSEEEFYDAIAAIRPDPDARYEFEFKPEKLKYVIYDIMKYPVLGYTDGKNGKGRKPKLDKYVIDKLLKRKLEEDDVAPRKLNKDILVYGASEEEYLRLREKGNDKEADAMVLVSAKEFNKLKYPLALILKKYADLNKEYTSYFKPMYEQNLEGKIFKGYNMARIETRRIANPGQTMKGKLKALIRSYTDDHYILDFDMSQVEYRIMLSLAGFQEMIQKMDDPESDFHTETASMVEAIPPHRITKKQRKRAKSVSFGVPYGLGDGSLCETMHGTKTKENMIATRLVLAKWKKSNKPIMSLLEKARESAMEEWKINDELRDFLGMWKKGEDGNFLLDENGKRIPIPVGRVENMIGFYRIFDLSNIDLSEAGKKRRSEGSYTAEESSIRRKAGNYPIQATAAELFRIILIRFYEECDRYGIQDKIIWHMLIHDELLCSVKKDVHPFLLYKIIKKACMITMKGHTKYFVGINIGDTWAEAKDDAREAPIHFVERIIKRYDAGEFDDGWFDHPWEFIKPYRDQYIEDRIGEVIEELQPAFGKEPLDLASLLENFSNYTVRAYVNDYAPNGDVGMEKNDDDPDSVAAYEDALWIKKLESWALKHYDHEVQFRSVSGEVYTVHSATEDKHPADDFSDDWVDYDDLFSKEACSSNDSYWSFDDESAEEIYFSESTEDRFFEQEEEEELQFDLNNSTAKDVNEMTIIKRRYENIKVLNNQVVINVASKRAMKMVKEFLRQNVVKIGKRVILKYPGVFEPWEKIRENTDLKKLDEVISILNCDFKGMRQADDLIFVKLSGHCDSVGLEQSLKEFQGDSYTLYFVTGKGELIKSVQFSKRVSLKKLENVVNSWR